MSGRIKVVQVVNSLAAAGAERTTVELARALPKDEFDVHVMVVRDGPLRKVLEEEGVSVHVTGGDFDWRWPLVVQRMRREIRDLRPAIVHTHLIGGDIVGGLAAHLEGVPVLVKTQHDTYRRSLPFDLFRRRSANWLDAVVAVSLEVADYCVDHLHVPREKIHIIENAVDVERFGQGISDPHGAVTFGAVGTLIPIKGHAVALAALALVLEHVPDARLLIAGAGPEADTLLRQAREKGIEGALELAGHAADVPEFLRRIDIFVHPSYQEGLPVAVLEAMAARKPVIASDLPAVRRVLDDGAAGALAPPGDAGALAEAMIDLATHPDSARELAAAGSERVGEHYSRERLAAEYAALYRDLLARKVACG